MSKFYITTAIPYVNGKPHIGHALEYFQADTIRRFQQVQGAQTLLLSGADENALKNVQAAEQEGVPVQEFLDRNAKVFEEAFERLGVQLDVFQRGSDKQNHWPGVTKLWDLCDKNGDIYKKSYTGLYCVGCESFKTPEELVDGLCPIHQKKPEEVNEENYFFSLSKYQDKLIELIESGDFKITPSNKKSETLGFIKSGLEDFSISRSKKRARGVGVPVPGDDTQVMYVWFDALTIYMTGIGFGADEEKWKKWWPADIHIIGKDINRFHTVYWPAMLLSAGLPLPKEVLIHSFINAPGGQKMSKSLGNVIDPFEMVDEYGLEPFRYYLLSQIPLDADGEISLERFKEVYNADLANGLGNLTARVAKLCETTGLIHTSKQLRPEEFLGTGAFKKAADHYNFPEALNEIWKSITKLDQYINEEKPWILLKTDTDKCNEVLAKCVDGIIMVAAQLQPFMPETAEKILSQFKGPEIISQKPLFPRL